MLNTNDVPQIMGATANDTAGDKIGKVGQVYLDDASGQPQWVTVSTGMFGTRESFVPVTQATFADGVLTVPVAKDAVKDAPQIDQDGHLSPEQETELYRHYGLSHGGTSDNGHADHAGTESVTTGHSDHGTAGHDVSGPETDSAMTRSEERLDVGTETVETGRARLRKFVTTHTETVEVPVQREEVRVVREPITDGNADAALSGGDLTEEEHDVVLTEERAVVSKETVPVERVQLDTETVTDTQTVTEDVQAEQIEVDGDLDRTGTTDGTVDSNDVRPGR